MDLMHLRITGDLDPCADSENQLDAASERIQNVTTSQHGTDMTAAFKTPIHFPQVAKKKKQPMRAIDTELLKVEHFTPIPGARRVNGKYDQLFDSMRFGSCIACEQAEMNSVATGLRKYLLRMDKAGKVVSVKNCDDGKSRVWLTDGSENG